MEKKTYSVTISNVKLETAIHCAAWLKRWQDEEDIIICENEGNVGTYYSLPEFMKKLSKKEEK